ncbi:hypothetical protein Bbelb_428710 [Branchiostoma belcheri]|nr:hypothetical protein Bbelb_428710 [Branchiostoma belcheri]
MQKNALTCGSSGLWVGFLRAQAGMLDRSEERLRCVLHTGWASRASSVAKSSQAANKLPTTRYPPGNARKAGTCVNTSHQIAFPVDLLNAVQLQLILRTTE